MERIYVRRDDDVTVVSRRRPRLLGIRRSSSRSGTRIGASSSLGTTDIAGEPGIERPLSLGLGAAPGESAVGLPLLRPPGTIARKSGAGLPSSPGPGFAAGRPDAQPVRRPWRGLVELPARTPPTRGDTALVFVPPAAIGALAAAFAPVEVGVAAGGLALVASTYFTPLLRRRLADRAAARRLTRPGNLLLTGARERAAWDRAVATADRISETWPALASLIDVAEAESLLAEALWEIAGVLAHRQELDRVLTELSRPDFAAAADETAGEVRYQLSAAKTARAEIEAELVRREASLRRAEEAGHDFIREQDMRRAIRAAEHSLRTTPPPGLPPTPPFPDAGADLAEHTRSVLDAYRELTAVLRPT